MVRTVLAIICFFIAGTSFANPRPSLPIERCQEHLPYGQPSSPKRTVSVICRQGYALLHDNKAKIPVWVAYSLTPQRVLGCFKRSSDWDAEPSVPPESSAAPKDYAKSRYDIGHMASNADMRWDRQVELESNVLSNAAPQQPALNRGPWKQLEDQTRAWVLHRGNPVLVYVGTIYSYSSSTIGKGRVVVPDAFWKVLVDQKTGEVISFLYPADAENGSPSSFLTSLAEVQRRSGLVLPTPRNYSLSKQLWPSQRKNAAADRKISCSQPE